MQDYSTPLRSQGPESNRSRVPSDWELLVVSNRQPYRHDAAADESDVTVDSPAGGLTAGLDPVMQRLGGTWIAWGDGDADRRVVDDDDCVGVPPGEDEYTLRRVWLSDHAVENYYYGFSNQVLWPLCHSLLGNVRCDPEFWSAYRAVNEEFAEAVVEQATADRSSELTVWFQDYHLGLASSMVRQRLADDATLVQFWHIPWPTWDVFRACPHGRDLLRGLLGNDVIAFHVPRYRQQFLRCVEAGLDEAVVDWEACRVHFRGRTTTVEATAMGVPVEDIRTKAATPEAQSFPVRFRAAHDIDESVRLAVGVDRLDYTKGIVQRLDALERLWETRPEWRGEVTYVQNASVSRERIPEYEAIADDVTDAVERVNDRFGTDDWRPVVFTTDHLSQAELYGLYRRADLALVSPIRDGMNLVAQEYVAAQGSDPGALVLSHLTGAYDVFGDNALAVNPYDVEGFAGTIDDALTMPPGERRRRMDGLRQAVADRDLSIWVDRSLELVRPPRTERTQV